MKFLTALGALLAFTVVEARAVEVTITAPPLSLPPAFEVEIAPDYRERLFNGGAKIWGAACCKVCKKGKACGNSCIKKSYNCTKGAGCACDG